ncbi:hypothetical protein, partial [Propionicimonas sp.]|uniref:hypothetical protein n=1 Tax=Propionicimonas sp. TaxID=1955623 RepID=UPI0039E22AE6
MPRSLSLGWLARAGRLCGPWLARCCVLPRWPWPVPAVALALAVACWGWLGSARWPRALGF